MASCPTFKVLLLNHHVKKGKLHLHVDSDDGPGPGTYPSQQQTLVLNQLTAKFFSVEVTLSLWILHFRWVLKLLTGEWCTPLLYTGVNDSFSETIQTGSWMYLYACFT